MAETIPVWLNASLHRVRTEGRLVLSGEDKVAEEIAELGSPAARKALGPVKTLDLSRNKIESLAGLPRFPRLVHFIANHSSLANFRNFSSLDGVSTVSLVATPISDIPTFRLALYLAIGPSLTSINGRMVTDALKRKAATYPAICREMINMGWIPVSPCPTAEELDSICESLGVESAERDFKDVMEEEEDEHSDTAVDFEELMARLKAEHEEMIAKGQAIFGIVGADSEAGDVNQRVGAILRTNNIDVEDANDDEAILRAVKSLCAKESP